MALQDSKMDQNARATETQSRAAKHSQPTGILAAIELEHYLRGPKSKKNLEAKSWLGLESNPACSAKTSFPG
jgi:hypothetical protein